MNCINVYIYVLYGLITKNKNHCWGAIAYLNDYSYIDISHRCFYKQKYHLNMSFQVTSCVLSVVFIIIHYFAC